MRLLLFALFFVSGAIGLVYESTWTQYLKLLLGHAANAQSLVLMTFMGGLALGAHLFGKLLERNRSPLRLYILVELLIGVGALLFHLLFLTAEAVLFDTLLPALSHPAAALAVRWAFASLIIFPQALLLGGTFPLMVASLAQVERRPEPRGSSIALVYFVNSMGAALGVLVCAFALIPELGLPGTMTVAGAVNLSIGLVLIAYLRRAESDVSTLSNSRTAVVGRSGDSSLRRLLMLVAGLTGLASFMYEIAWIRMLSLVLGSSSHAFELMLSAFILGIAIGGWVIRNRIERTPNTLALLGRVQIAMAVFAVATLVAYNFTFDAMALLLSMLTKTAAGYVAYNVTSHALVFVFMLPATICAGMTLPLISQAVLARKGGRGAIGRVYAVNTAGSLVGVLLAVQLVMPWLGLKAVVVLGGLVDLCAGLWLLAASRYERRPLGAGIVAVGFLAIAVVAELDPAKMVSGVFLERRTSQPRHVIFHADGKTASIDVFEQGLYTSIATNGKVDAAISRGAPSKDEPTMTLLAALPLALKPDTQTAAVIGFGSGLTSATLLDSVHVTRVDTIELEPKMIEGARLMSDSVTLLEIDARSRIHIDDAKSFFTVQPPNQRYDLIISEPSNPWVGGIAGLFSKEHYQVLVQRIHTDGLLAQWLHIYDLNVEIVGSVAKAIHTAFPYYEIYSLNNTDLLIVAGLEPVPRLHGGIFENPNVAQRLARIGVESTVDLEHRRLGSQAIHPYFESLTAPAHSDFYPLIGQRAVRARFMKEDALELQRFRMSPVAVVAELENRPRLRRRLTGDNVHLFSARRSRQAYAFLDWVDGETTQSTDDNEAIHAWSVLTLPCGDVDELKAGEIQTWASRVFPYLALHDLERLLAQLGDKACADSVYAIWLEVLTDLVHRRYDEALAHFDELSGKDIAESWRVHAETVRALAALQAGRRYEPRWMFTGVPELELLIALNSSGGHVSKAR